MRSGYRPIARVTLVATHALAVAILVVATAGAALGRAPYRAERFDLAHDLVRDELPWTNEAHLGFPARKPRDADGVPMVRCDDGRLVYPMGTLSMNGMKRLDAYLDTGDERQLAQALAQAQRLRLLAVERGTVWWLPHECDYPPERQDAPWWNAMTQGLAVSFFVRLREVTGDDLHLDAAWRVFRSFPKLGPRAGPWVSFVDADRYLWLEHYPRRRPSHVLNAHLHGVIGLYELWDATRDPEVRLALRGAITTIRAQVWRYRRPGRVSFYDLGNRTVHAHYHAIVIWQLRFLARITGDDYFWRIANRLANDAAPPPSVPGRPGIQRRPASMTPIDGPPASVGTSGLARQRGAR